MSQDLTPYRPGAVEPLPRYEIVDQIASGDFATVYRARDRELGREVAIKAIHQQYLDNPRQLERYWHEAQLLATLQHPNILTIYDIVRARGWLVLELMRGNLARAIEAGPLDFDSLRLALGCCLSALHFLHGNGVIHGDVKPSNMLADAQGRVKLGDFGLARRVSNEQGSLLKGTTKYMAPELVSSQFGPVGPASDLYSLGFSAYELLCGPQFDALFPGLGTFGRDRQIAWLLWHAAPDRHLPPIARVLEGVPPDLAHVIERLAAKDQGRRYHSAAEVLEDLRAGRGLAAGEPPAAGPCAPPPGPKQRLPRAVAIAAVACSVLLSVLMLLPGSRERPRAPLRDLEGIVVQVDADNRKMVVESSADGSRVERGFTPGDRFQLNFKPSFLRHLKAGDRVKIETAVDEEGRQVALVYAARAERAEGRIRAVDPEAEKLVVSCGPGENQELEVLAPRTAKILFNGKEVFDRRPPRLADLKPGDRVVLRYDVGTTNRTAVEIEAQRPVEIEGAIREVDVAGGELIVSLGKQAGGERVKLPLAPDCEVVLNGATILDGKPLKPGDLRPGDLAKVTHDAQVRRVEAYRPFGESGTIEAVLADGLVVKAATGKTASFAVGKDTKITLAGDPAPLAELCVGDQVEVTHDMPGAARPEARQIAAQRPSNPARWAMIVGVGAYHDPRLGPLPVATAAAKTIHETLVKRHAVPAGQALLLADPPVARLADATRKLLSEVRPDHEVVVYYAGRAVRDKDGKVYLAARDSRRDDPAGTGMALQQLVDQLEASPAKTKLLLLDASHAAPEPDPDADLSSAEMFQSLQGPPGQAALRTVTGIASGAPGERGATSAANGPGVFAAAVAEGYSGKADKNRDNQIEPSELFAWLVERIPSAGVAGGQTPQLFLPDNRPPRLAENAKKAIRALAAQVRAGDADASAAKTLYSEAQSLAGREVEPRLLYGLVLLKSKQLRLRAEALKHFETLKAEKPDLLLPLEVLAWLRFERRLYPAGIDDLTELMSKIPRPKKPKEALPAELVYLFPWVGRLREFAAMVDERPVPEPSLARLDAAVAAHGAEAVKLYEQGREATRAVASDFDAKAASATDEATRAKLKIDRRQVAAYAVFPFDDAVQAILAGMDR